MARDATPNELSFYDQDSYTPVNVGEAGWGTRLGASVDRATSDLLGVAEAAGADGFADTRRRLQYQSEVNRARAVRDTGAPESYKDIDGPGALGQYVGGLFVDSAPELGVSAATGVATGGLGLGLGTVGRMAVGAGAMYPLAVGDVLANQREQAGRTDLGAAGALAVPYVAADLIGVEGALMRGGRAINAGLALDAAGITGRAARRGATVGVNMLAEGGSETIQEGVNQFGRMSVDPAQPFFDDDSIDRFGESFVGGALMGGSMGVFGSTHGRDALSTGTRSVADAVNDRPYEPDVERPDFALAPTDGTEGSYGLRETDAPLAVNNYDPNQRELFDSQGNPTYGADASFGRYTLPEQDPMQGITTSPGAAPMYDGGIDFTPDFDTGNLALRAPMNAPTPDMFGGPARTAEDMAPPMQRPMFELEMQEQGPVQGELDFQPGPAAPTTPALPHGQQRGITGQLPFSANTRSPRGQVLQGLVDSLMDEGHMDEGTHQAVSYLIAKGQFAAAKKGIDAAVKEKQAADALTRTAERLAEKDNASSGRGDDDSADRDAGAQPAVPATVAGSGDAVAGEAGAAVPADGAGAAVAQADGQPDGRAGEDGAAGGAEPEPLLALSDDALIERIDTVADEQAYTDAIAEMYRRWYESDEPAPIFEQYLDENIGNEPARRAFTATWNKAEQDYTASKSREGRRGLRVGRSNAGTASSVSAETDAILRGMPRGPWLPNSETTGTREGTDTARNPDRERDTEPETPVDEARRWRNGGDAARWYAQHGSTPYIRLLAKKIEPYIRNVQFRVVDPATDNMPARLRHEMTAKGVRGVYMPETDAVAVRFDSVTETTIMHELLHAAAVEAMDARVNPKGRQEFIDLMRNTMESMRTLAQSGALDADTVEGLRFFFEVFSDEATGVDEYVAYTMTSPVFREFSKRLNADGTLRPDTPTPSSATRPTLWMRFVDAVRNLFGLPQLYRNDTAELIEAGGGSQLLDQNLAVLDAILSVRGRGDGAASTAPRYNREAVGGRDGGAARSEPTHRALAAEVERLAGAIGVKNTLVERLKEAAYNARESRGLLPAMTNDQIAESFKNLKGLLSMNRATGRMGRVANSHMEMTAQVAKKWNALTARNANAAAEMQRLMLESTLDQMHVSIKDGDTYLSAEQAFRHKLNRHLDPAQKERFAAMHRRFMALPAEARTVYDAVRDDLSEKHKQTLSALEGSVLHHYGTMLKVPDTPGMSVDEKLKAMEKSAKTNEQKRTARNARRAITDIREELGTINGPYFPLVRFGDHVVILKSKDLNAATDAMDAARTDLNTALENAENATDETAEALNAAADEARARYNDAQRRVETLKRDGKHYDVSFHEKPWGARKAIEQLQAANPEADVVETKREVYLRGLDGASPAFLHQLQNVIGSALDTGSGVDSTVRDRTLQAVNDLYARRQPERSALRSELRRMGVEGVKAQEMLRGYVQSGRNSAWRISRLQHGDEVVRGMEELAADRSPQARDVLNEMKRRFSSDYTMPEANKMVQSLQQATYFMHLGFNASYMLANSTQAWVVSLPILGGRHGFIRSANELAAASREVIAGLKDATAQSVRENGVMVGIQLRLTDEQLAAMGKTDGERAMLRALTNDGVIDITMKHDMGAITDGAGGLLSKTVEVSSVLANFPELYNRLSTALAAYRMEVGRAGTGPSAEAAATEYAEHIINRTHFNYSPENAPRMMRGQFQRLMFQFRRYQQGMIYLFGTLAKKAWRGDVEAQRQLLYLTGSHMAVAGAAGIPIAWPVQLATKMVAALWPDDDEPELLQQFYNGMKDAVGEKAAQVLTKGLPALANMDMTMKLGAGDIFNPAPFARVDGKKVFSREFGVEVAFGLGGAGLGQLLKQWHGIGLMQDGEWGRAAVNGLPTFMAMPLRAWREATGGIESMRGDVLVEPSEFGIGDTVLRSLGFANVNTSDMYDRRRAFMDMTQNRKEARTKLMQTYYRALKDGDSEGIAAAREAIQEYNQRQPEDPIRQKNLRSMVRAKTNGDAEMRGGLRVRERDEGTYRRLMGED